MSKLSVALFVTIVISALGADKLAPNFRPAPADGKFDVAFKVGKDVVYLFENEGKYTAFKMGEKLAKPVQLKEEEMNKMLPAEFGKTHKPGFVDFIPGDKPSFASVDIGVIKVGEIEAIKSSEIKKEDVVTAIAAMGDKYGAIVKSANSDSNPRATVVYKLYLSGTEEGVDAGNWSSLQLVDSNNGHGLVVGKLYKFNRADSKITVTELTGLEFGEKSCMLAGAEILGATASEIGSPVMIKEKALSFVHEKELTTDLKVLADKKCEKPGEKSFYVRNTVTTSEKTEAVVQHFVDGLVHETIGSSWSLSVLADQAAREKVLCNNDKDGDLSVTKTEYKVLGGATSVGLIVSAFGVFFALL